MKVSTLMWTVGATIVAALPLNLTIPPQDADLSKIPSELRSSFSSGPAPSSNKSLDNMAALASMLGGASAASGASVATTLVDVADIVGQHWLGLDLPHNSNNSLTTTLAAAYNADTDRCQTTPPAGVNHPGWLPPYPCCYPIPPNDRLMSEQIDLGLPEPYRGCFQSSDGQWGIHLGQDTVENFCYNKWEIHSRSFMLDFVDRCVADHFQGMEGRDKFAEAWFKALCWNWGNPK